MLENAMVTLTNRYGYNEAEPVYCPVCGEECEHVYRIRGSWDVMGCENCLIEEESQEFKRFASEYASDVRNKYVSEVRNG